MLRAASGWSVGDEGGIPVGMLFNVVNVVLGQVLASVKNKIEQFASVERDFPGLLIQAQQYLLFRVDMSDLSPESLTKGEPGSPISSPPVWLPRSS